MKLLHISMALLALVAYYPSNVLSLSKSLRRALPLSREPKVRPDGALEVAPQSKIEKALVFGAFSILHAEDHVQTFTHPDLCETYTLVMDGHEPKTDTFFLVYKNPYDHYVVSFRGTHMSKWRNYLTLMMFYRSRCNFHERCGRIHAGFLRSFRHVRPILQPVLKKAKRISFSGHSLGGALAIIAAYYFRRVQRYPVVNCYVFGSPRIGNHLFEVNFAMLKGVDEMRLVTTHGRSVDFIPSLPFGYFFSRPLRPYHWFDHCGGKTCDRTKMSRVSFYRELHQSVHYYAGIRKLLPEGTCARLDSEKVARRYTEKAARKSRQLQSLESNAAPVLESMDSVHREE